MKCIKNEFIKIVRESPNILVTIDNKNVIRRYIELESVKKEIVDLKSNIDKYIKKDNCIIIKTDKGFINVKTLSYCKEIYIIHKYNKSTVQNIFYVLEKNKHNDVQVIVIDKTFKQIYSKIEEYIKAKYDVNMKQKTRSHNVSIMRHIISYFLYTHSNVDVVSIGKLMNKDHTTILYGIRNIESIISSDICYDRITYEKYKEVSKSINEYLSAIFLSNTITNNII